MQSSFVLCLGNSVFMIVDLTFDGQWHVFPVRRQPPCSGKFACFGNHTSLATRNRATIEVILAKCHYYSSKLCLQFRPFETRSVQHMRLRKNYGTPVHFKASHHPVVVLLVLAATLVLPIAWVHLLKLQKQGATIVLPCSACHLAHLRPDLYGKGGCARII